MNLASSLRTALRSSTTAHNNPLSYRNIGWRNNSSQAEMARSEMTPKQKVGMLREMMSARRIDAYVVPSEDDHSSEYLAECDMRRAYISHFTGSAGCAVITADAALLWTDGRYWLSAEKELDPSWKLMKQGMEDVPSWSAWLAKELPKPSTIAIDPRLISFSDLQTLKSTLNPSPSPPSSSLTLKPISENLIDDIWSTSRPARHASKVFVLEEKYSGQKFVDKIEALREGLKKDGSGGLVVSMLDEVAWLFNLRGDDIAYNPVFFSYALLTPTTCKLYIRATSLSPEVTEHLKAGGVEIMEYSDVWDDLKIWGKELMKLGVGKGEGEEGGKKDGKEVKGKVVVGQRTSWAVVEALGEDNVDVKRSPVMDLKSIKNDTEVEGFRQCHTRDGAALVRYFSWLQKSLLAGEQISEYDAAMKLKWFREQGDLFKGLSFDTISSTGANGAIIHYSPSATESKIIDPSKMYLCDSGGQYMDGTTDTTRTLHFGQPTAEEIRANTRVLQGHIAIDRAVFPTGTTGFQLDVFARRPLWEEGLDYRHGTSHGVGSFLNVHEGPQGIGSRISYNDTPLKLGMVMSNEPGYYKDGEFGIRIENMIAVVKAKTANDFGGKGYLGFEHVTMCPIQTKLVDVDLLTKEERKWLNSYHAEVLASVKPLLEKADDKTAVEWLEMECMAV